MEIRPLQRAEFAPASRLLGRAFDHDPVIGSLWADGRRRRYAFPALFRSAMHDLVGSGSLFGAFDDGVLLAAAVWQPPTSEPSHTVRSRANVLWLRALFPRATPEVFAMFERLGHLHPDRPHWYLAFVGVDPHTQSRGIGARLLAPVHERADAEGVACYLETPFARTHPFYERLGYTVREELRPLATDAPLWTMLREPQ